MPTLRPQNQTQFLKMNTRDKSPELAVVTHLKLTTAL